MNAEQIRSLPTEALKMIVNGLAYAQGHKWADRTAALIASAEMDRRDGGARFSGNRCGARA